MHYVLACAHRTALLCIALGRRPTLFGSAAAHAQAYPSKPITIIVPFGPGSATDTITPRHRPASRDRAQPDDRGREQAGANGAIAAHYVARSAPDGYTLFMSTNSPHSAAPA